MSDHFATVEVLTRRVEQLAAGDPDSTRLVYAIVIALLVVGVLLVLLAVWMIRRTRADMALLAPLERMSDSKWRKSDPAGRRALLDEVRPPGAEAPTWPQPQDSAVATALPPPDPVPDLEPVGEPVGEPVIERIVASEPEDSVETAPDMPAELAPTVEPGLDTPVVEPVAEPELETPVVETSVVEPALDTAVVEPVAEPPAVEPLDAVEPVGAVDGVLDTPAEPQPSVEPAAVVSVLEPGVAPETDAMAPDGALEVPAPTDPVVEPSTEPPVEPIERVAAPAVDAGTPDAAADDASVER